MEGETDVIMEKPVDSTESFIRSPKNMKKSKPAPKKPTRSNVDWDPEKEIDLGNVLAERNHWRSLALIAHTGKGVNKNRFSKKKQQTSRLAELYSLYHGAGSDMDDRYARPFGRSTRRIKKENQDYSEKQQRCQESFRNTVSIAKKIQADHPNENITWQEAMKRAFAQQRESRAQKS